MNTYRRDVGKFGETLAEKYFCSKRYTIKGRNITTPFGEIDLVAMDGNCLVFIEVKTRISGKFGEPLASITASKRKTILKNCQYYIKCNALQNRYWRIDAVGIELNKELDLEVMIYAKNAVMED
ncbi:MAG: YraN family protein [Candidatus Omnitrophota bacterium]|nr:YraN family protein [Candidatus Omnitrophota bacterium]